MATVFLSASDGLVITMLVIMAVSLGIVALLFFCMRRNAARRDPQVDALLEELAAEEEKAQHAPSTADAPVCEPWERDGDWWKQ